MFGFGFQSPLHAEAKEAMEEFARVCPPPSKITKARKPIPENKIAASLESLNKRIASYVQKKRLGVIGRARLAKALQNEMGRLGYPDELSSRVVSAITVNALVAPRRRRD